MSQIADARSVKLSPPPWGAIEADNRDETRPTFPTIRRPRGSARPITGAARVAMLKRLIREVAAEC